MYKYLIPEVVKNIVLVAINYSVQPQNDVCENQKIPTVRSVYILPTAAIVNVIHWIFERW